MPEDSNGARGTTRPLLAWLVVGVLLQAAFVLMHWDLWRPASVRAKWILQYAAILGVVACAIGFTILLTARIPYRDLAPRLLASAGRIVLVLVCAAVCFVDVLAVALVSSSAQAAIAYGFDRGWDEVGRFGGESRDIVVFNRSRGLVINTTIVHVVSEWRLVGWQRTVWQLYGPAVGVEFRKDEQGVDVVVTADGRPHVIRVERP